MANEHILRLRQVKVEEILSEDDVLKKDPTNPFIDLAARPEPYRSYFVAYARLEPVFQKEKIHSPLIVETPEGRGLVWRWWPTQIGVVFMRPRGNDWILDERVTFLKPNEQAKITFVLDQIVLNPPKWS